LPRALIQAESRDLEQLGRDLGKHVKSKKQPFSYSALSNFVLGKAPATVELVEALCKEYSRLPPPVFFPSSYEESAMMLGIAERYAGKAIDYGFEGDIVPLPRGTRAPAAPRTRRSAGGREVERRHAGVVCDYEAPPRARLILALTSPLPRERGEIARLFR
jgi:hypothetical protein